jgi:hypothetical protein
VHNGCAVHHIVIKILFTCQAFLDITSGRGDILVTRVLSVGGIDIFLVHSLCARQFQVSVLHFYFGCSEIRDTFLSWGSGRRKDCLAFGFEPGISNVS